MDSKDAVPSLQGRIDGVIPKPDRRRRSPQFPRQLIHKKNPCIPKPSCPILNAYKLVGLFILT
jgi:hypothetical protein